MNHELYCYNSWLGSLTGKVASKRITEVNNGLLSWLCEKEDRMWAGGLTVRELVNQKDTFS